MRPAKVEVNIIIALFCLLCQLTTDPTICSGSSLTGIYTFSGYTSPSLFVIRHCSTVIVEFYSDISVVGAGFGLFYSSAGYVKRFVHKKILALVNLEMISSVTLYHFPKSDPNSFDGVFTLLISVSDSRDFLLANPGTSACHLLNPEIHQGPHTKHQNPHASQATT